jgi:hypothetical protein
VHAVLLDANLSVGQVPKLPVQFSGTSHALAAPRHTTVAGLYSSTQVAAVPLQ